MILLVLALAEPFSPSTIFGGGAERVVLLEDNSSSYSLFGDSIGGVAYTSLKQVSRTQHHHFGGSIVSDVGDALTDALRDGNNIFLLSDGYVTHGVDLSSVETLARTKNKSISWLQQPVVETDYSVSIVGPDKVGPNIDTTVSVVVRGTDATPQLAQLFVDGKEVLMSKAGTVDYTKMFSEGNHELMAKLTGKDHFSENNIFYKTLKVVEKPKVLYMGEIGSPLHASLSKLYTVETGPLYNLDRYHTVVIDNQDESQIKSSVKDLRKYIEKGNGLVVVGGKQAFDGGDYQGSSFEDLLPVTVSGSGKKSGSTNLVLLIDLSGSTGANNAANQAQLLATNIIETLDKGHNIGIILFAKDVIDVWPLTALSTVEESEITQWVASHPPTSDFNLNLEEALQEAQDLFAQQAGGKNIIIFGDGDTGNLNLGYYITECKTCPPEISDKTLRELNDEGVSIYSVGVGQGTSLSDYETLSELTGGAYYSGLFSVQELSLLFGDPTKQTSSDSNAVITVYSDTHFITEGVIPTATVHGTNQVLPKNSAELLLTSGTGDPLLSVWRTGLGRVAVLSSDNGQQWAGEMYKGSNSKIISRMLSWTVGDPERKKDTFFKVDDPRVGEDVILTFVTEKLPIIEGVSFSREADGSYSTTTTASTSGFYSLGEYTYSVNYPREYERLGNNMALASLVTATGGKTLTDLNALVSVEETLKASETVTHGEEELFIWPLLALAMAIFILDVWFRTVQERKNI